MRVGGRVEWLLEPRDPDEVREAVLAARERGVEPRVLGGGANLIVRDGVLPGVVVGTDRLQRLFRPGAEAAERPAGELLDPAVAADVAPPERGRDPRLVAWCGATLPRLVRTAQQLGLSGLEGLVGVPGCVGGGVAMNAGGRWGVLWDVIESVRVLEPDGTVADLPREACSPGYRDGGMAGRLVLGAVFRLAPDNPAAVRARMREYLLEKQAAQPVTEWSAGCVFRNPDPERSGGRSAGKLVEDCGGKARRRGDAIVSPKHGNFIVNAGRASADDVFGLIEDLRALVADRTGVLLEVEVKTWR